MSDGIGIIGVATPHVPEEWFLRPDGESYARGIHGVGHTLRVWVHAQEIAHELGLAPWEREVLHHAALWHDVGRTHDGADYYHGAKSAGKVVGLGLHAALDPVVADTALELVTHHCGDEGHAERAMQWLYEPEASLRLFRILKDADALDRVRLSDGVDPSFLRFPVSHGRIERACELLRATR